MNTYNTYFLRCLPEDYDDLIAFGVTLGIIQVQTIDGQQAVSTVGPGAWDFVGQVMKPTGNNVLVDGVLVPETAPAKHPNGKEYVHVNLRTTLDIYEIAQQMAPTNPGVAAAMSNVARFFIPGTPGRGRAPNKPQRVFL
jgi:hypothetical protein